jgi:thymidylate synthase (FAD)
MRHWHTTPFEMVEFKFHIKMPIFIARQHMRHRTASINELSGRYSEMPEEYFVPDHYRLQAKTNKQSSEGVLETTQHPENVCKLAFDVYRNLLEDGCCKELARCHLPLSTFTEFYWKINLHNLMHYLQLRMEDGAQEEIRVYANEIFKIVEPLLPITMEAFLDFRVNSMNLSGSEIEAFKNNTKLESPGEQREFENKMKRLK